MLLGVSQTDIAVAGKMQTLKIDNKSHILWILRNFQKVFMQFLNYLYQSKVDQSETNH